MWSNSELSGLAYVALIGLYACANLVGCSMNLNYELMVGSTILAVGSSIVE